MRIQFCGANRSVTGSCHLIEVGRRRVLLDCGIFQGPRAESRRLNEWLPQDAASVDAVILSHGHLDHCGKLPVLARAGFRGPIYCTAATFDVARIVLIDSAEIQEEDAAYLNRREREPAEPRFEPLYRTRDVQNVLALVRPVRYGQRVALGDSAGFTFFDAGHILGSAYVLLDHVDDGRPQTLLFTGDIGRYGTPIVRDPQPPPRVADQIIAECTYGDRAHAPMDEVAPQLLDALRDCVARGGRMILPAFAVGRTQVILHYVQRFIHEKHIPQLRIYIDSPMGVEVSEVHLRSREDWDDQTRRMIGTDALVALSHVTFASTPQQSREINSDRGPCVIIASSPTCEFGRVLHHLRHSVEDDTAMVVFTGYVPPGTLGRRLQEGQKRVRIYDRWYDVRCGVRTIHGLSAHADAQELMRFLKPALSEKTTAYLVHGEVPQAEGFARRLLSEGVKTVLIPAIETETILSLESARKPAAASQTGHVTTDGD